MMWHTGEAVRTLLKERGTRTEKLMEWLGVSRPTAFGLLRRPEWTEAYRRLLAPHLGVTVEWLHHGDGQEPRELAWQDRGDVQEAVRRAEERIRGAMQAALVGLRDDLGRIAEAHMRGRLGLPPAPAVRSRVVPLDERALASPPARLREGPQGAAVAVAPRVSNSAPRTRRG